MISENREKAFKNNDFARKHGIYSVTPPIAGQTDFDLYSEILEGLLKEYKPKKATDKLLVQQVAFLFLRLNRINKYLSDLEEEHLIADELYATELDTNNKEDQQRMLKQKMKRYNNSFRNESAKRIIAEEGHLYRQINTILDKLR